MSEGARRFTGGCLCGAVRYEADGEPMYMGHCYCADCRRASGSGFVPFMGFLASAVRFSGETRIFKSRAARGGDAVRNSCPVCGSLVFGGIVGQDAEHTIYAGTLDDPSLFRPAMAIFNRDRPAWALLPPDITVFETMPE
ncbi:MAG: GFA family protein [Caulobacterales bacterium]